MAISAEEQNFNNKVENAPIVKEILGDLDGLKKGQEKMELRMNSLEQKVDDGFKQVVKSLGELKDEIKSDKEKALLESNAQLKAELTRKRNNTDKIKNGTITGSLLTILTIVLENLGVINVIG